MQIENCFNDGQHRQAKAKKRQQLKNNKPILTIDQTGQSLRGTAVLPDLSLKKLSRRITAYMMLTKPSIMLLVLVTGGTALIVEGSFLNQPSHLLIFLVGLYLTGGCANALNQLFERDIDARMTRTMKRRPLPKGQLEASEAFWFSITIGVVGLLILGLVFNLLTAFLSLGTILFYSLFYTLWLKPNSMQNIVIGGVAGAMAPIGAWAAATGTVGAEALVMFLVVFLWTPPHFWALAYCYRDDYRRTKLPMLPVMKDLSSTLNYISVYSVALIIASLGYFWTGGGSLYLILAIILGSYFLAKVFVARRKRDEKSIWAIFTASIIYLFGLFLAMIIDKFAMILF